MGGTDVKFFWLSSDPHGCALDWELALLLEQNAKMYAMK